ncbi:MAG: class I SAM-dependent methyltransferase, partial [Bacteroidetes bacterium]|nr:class I SAM-dependent methyltransferase [Bacteroidota bacterium]
FYSEESYFVNRNAGKEAPGYVDYFEQCTPAVNQEYFSILRQNAPPAAPVSFLDVGCGPGGLLYEARAHGWKATGLEISRWAAERGKAQGLNIIEGTLHDAKLPDTTFDMISMFDVLEHLPHPREYVAEIHRILKPGGTLVIETPNIKGFFVRHLYRASSDMVKPRAHICLYAPETAQRLLEGSGFSRIRITLFPWCRKITPGYIKGVIVSRIRGKQPVQLTWNESMRIVATR